MLVPSIYCKVPKQHAKEYFRAQAALFKSRVRFFCFSVFLFYLGGSSLSNFLIARVFRQEEITLCAVLAAAVGVLLIANQRARSLRSARIGAYLLTGVILTFFSHLSMLYPYYLESNVALMMFILFLIAFTLPWTVLDILFLLLLHLVSYTALFAYYQKSVLQVDYRYFDMVLYYRGLILLLMSGSLCFIIRRKEGMRNIQNFVLLKEVEWKQTQMERELKLATRVHKTLLPRTLIGGPMDIATTYLPMSYMGGDYARFHYLGPDKVILMLCDVTGHGVPAALVVNRIHAEFEILAQGGCEPGVLLRRLNDFMLQHLENVNMYLSAFCCTVDLERMRVLYSNHGHPAQYLYDAAGERIRGLKSQGTLLGLPMNEDEPIYQEEEILEPGGGVLLFSDGLIEATNTAGEEFGAGRVERFIRKRRNFAADVFTEMLVDEVRYFRGTAFDDDIFVLNARMRGQKGPKAAPKKS